MKEYNILTVKAEDGNYYQLAYRYGEYSKRELRRELRKQKKIEPKAVEVLSMPMYRFYDNVSEMKADIKVEF